MTHRATEASLTPAFVTRWIETLPDVRIEQVAPVPATTGVFSADLINGFLREGPLASPRIDALTDPVLRLLNRAWEYGVKHYVFLQDTHTEDNPEFRAYPPHCIAGTSQSEMIPEIARLPFADAFHIVEKNSLHPAVETTFNELWDEQRHINRAIVIGDCTDLCVNHLAMHLRMRANALGLQEFDVIVPANCVDTFDIPESEDLEPGAAHPGDFFHEVFLYHLASNGIRVVNSIV
ncbi:MAG: cysteine hydrolase [Chloroflexota bacterium]|nr:cysteine hydrolase [Chloroflexota bacterium]